jgi:DNA processing protein
VDRAAWVALSLCKHLGGKTFTALLAHFDHDLHAVLRADAKTLQAVRGIGAKIAQSILAVDLDGVRRRMDQWQANGVQIITRQEDSFPVALRTLDDAPPTVFLRGSLPDLTGAVAVVGTRQPSRAGHQAALAVSRSYAMRGCAVISGLAHGIDTVAHLGAIPTPTVAVLGNGILQPYPPENHDLAETILAHHGALLCEVAPDSAVSAPGLVARNRIITGLSQTTVIVETSATGGAMHAARFAQAQGKDLRVCDLDADGNRQLRAQGVPVMVVRH